MIRTPRTHYAVSFVVHSAIKGMVELEMTINEWMRMIKLYVYVYIYIYHPLINCHLILMFQLCFVMYISVFSVILCYFIFLWMFIFVCSILAELYLP